MNKISSKLDTISERLEAAGLIKEARELDVISNTIDKYATIDPYAATLIAHVKGDMNKIQKAADEIKAVGKKGLEEVGSVGDILDKYNLKFKSSSGAALENLCSNLLKIK